MVDFDTGPMSMGMLLKKGHSLGGFNSDALLNLDFDGGYWCNGTVLFITDNAVLMHIFEDDAGKYEGKNVSLVPLDGLHIGWWDHAEKESKEG